MENAKVEERKTEENKIQGGTPKKKHGTVNFLGLCSDQQLSFSPCWIEHLFLIIITPRSSNLVENFLFHE